MRKLLLSFLIILISLASQSQEAIKEVSRNFFRSNPFNSEFSEFLDHLFNDPELTNKVITKKTDSTLFHFSATYTKYNPFFFKPKRINVILGESIIPAVDSIPADTIYYYQVAAFNNNDEKSIKETRKEYEKILKRCKKIFLSNTTTESPDSSQLKWATNNFFVLFHGIAPFAVSWVGPDEKKEICLLLTLRLDSSNNMAVLP